MEGWYSTKCKLTWKLKGTKYNRLYFQLAPSTLPTEGIGFGLLPTVVAYDSTPDGPNNHYQGIAQMAKKDLLPTPTSVQRDHPERVEALKATGATTMMSRNNGENRPNSIIDHMNFYGLLRTPTAAEAKNQNSSSQIYLQNQVGATPKLLPTPMASEAIERRNMKTVVKIVETGSNQTTLTTMAKYGGLLPTPAAVDHKQTTLCESQRERSTLPGLMVKTYLLPTPTVMDTNCGDLNKIDQRRMKAKETSNNGNGFGTTIGELANRGMLPTPATRDYKGARSTEALQESGRNETNSLPDMFHQTGKTSQLNPRFVAEMMGFPPNWLELPFQSTETKA
jgi:hypothetical protein